MGEESDKVRTFRRLHGSGTFVMPNPWDVGSARALAQLGFEALATTSAGFAWTLGRSDTSVRLEEALEHFATLSAAVPVPLNADFEDGYAVEPDHVYENVLRAAGTGVAGLSVEDSTRGSSEPLHDFDLAVERVRAARRAVDDSGTGVLLTARTEGFVVGRPDLDETTRRVRAFAQSGADCVYAPRITTVEQVRAVVEAADGTPVNLLVNAPFTTVAEAAALGIRRISVGGTLARAAWGGLLDAAREIRESGTFTAFAELPNVDGLFAADDGWAGSQSTR